MQMDMEVKPQSPVCWVVSFETQMLVSGLKSLFDGTFQFEDDQLRYQRA